MGWKEPVEERGRIHRRTARNGLRQVRQADQHEQDEGDGREQRVERERAREERDVVFVGGLQGAAEEPDGCLVPPAGSNPLQACGSS